MGTDLKGMGFQSETVDKSAYLEKLREQIGSGFTDKPTDIKKRNEMGKDDFLKLMTAQMKHQDPINPMKNEEMAAQLAQFSSLEQMLNMNLNLEKMANSQRPQEKVWAASLIGKSIATDTSRFHLEKGKGSEMKFDLLDDAEKVVVSIFNEKGESIRDVTMGSLKKGTQKGRWDGKTGEGQDCLPGNYSFRVVATSKNDTPVQSKTASNGLVSGVVFENNQALLVVAGQKIPLSAVDKIEMGGGSEDVKTPPAAPMPAAAGMPSGGADGANNLSAAESLNKALSGAGAMEANNSNLVTQNNKNGLQSAAQSEKINTDIAAAESAEEAEEDGAGWPSGTGVWNPNL